MLTAVPMPSDVGIIDLMMALPITDPEQTYAFLKKGTRDTASRQEFRFPAEYMFKDVPDDRGKDADPVGVEEVA